MAYFSLCARSAFRAVRRRPVLAVLSALALGLGIGMTTAIISVGDRLLWLPLAIQHPERVVVLYHIYPKLGLPHADVSPPSFATYRNQSDLFDGVTAMAPELVMNLTSGPEPVQIEVQPVTSNFFEVLGVRMALGRWFSSGEDELGHSLVAVLSHGLWEQRFGASPNVIGRAIEINGVNLTVIGVAPSGLRVYGHPDVWIPFVLRPSELAETQNGNEFLTVIARLRPGITTVRASAALAVLSRRIRQRYPQYYPESSQWHIGMASIRGDMLGETQPAIFVLLAAVALVYLIAAFNVAILILASIVSRSREIAMRVALGSSRSWLMLQFTLESVFLMLAGSVTGLLLAYSGLKVLGTRIPIPLSWPVSRFDLDVRTLAFTVLLAGGTALVFGLVGVRQVSAKNIAAELNQSAMHSVSGVRARTLRQFLVVQVALSTVLLLGALVLIRSFRQLQRVNLGFRPEHVVCLRVGLPRSRYAAHTTISTFERIIEAVTASNPEFRIAVTSALPLEPVDRGALFAVRDHPPSPGTMLPHADFRVVSLQFFRTLGIKLIRGRTFAAEDSPQSLPVIIIDELTARRFWPTQDPVGNRIALSFETINGRPKWREIVGVVGAVRQSSPEQTPDPTLYVPLSQMNGLQSGYIVAHSSGDDSLLIDAIRRAVTQVDPELPTDRVISMPQIVERSLGPRRDSMLLVTFFSAVALTLAGLAIFGSVSYLVGQRRHEMAIRLALGCSTVHLFGLVVREAALVTALGLTSGSAVFAVMHRVVGRFSFDVMPTDPMNFVFVYVLFLLVALAAAVLPAFRATQAAPAMALRSQ